MAILDIRAQRPSSEISVIHFTDSKYVRYSTDEDVVIGDNMLPGSSMVLKYYQVQDMIEALQLALKYWGT